MSDISGSLTTQHVTNGLYICQSIGRLSFGGTLNPDTTEPWAEGGDKTESLDVLI